MSVRYGIIGCGRQAPKHISGLKANGVADILVADLDADRAAELARDSGNVAVATVEEVLADPMVKAISVCTPPASHTELILKAIAAGKPFLCEKPLAGSVDEARQIERAATAAGVIGMVGYIYRYAPAFAFARSALEAGALGEVRSATFRLGGPGSHGAWQHRRRTDGGAINEMLVHMLDLALWYFGAPAEAELLRSDMRTEKREIAGEIVSADVEDWVLARLRMPNGAEILLQTDLTTPIFLQYAEIHGDNGTLFGSIQSELPSFLHCTDGVRGFDAGRTAIDTRPRNLFIDQIAAFLHCVAEGTAPSSCTLSDSVALQDVIDRLRDPTPAASA